MICLSIIKQIDSVSQKQPLEVFSEKRFSYKFHKIHRKTSVPILFFNKVAGLRPASLLKKRPWHRCFPLNFAKFLRTPFYRRPLGDCFHMSLISNVRNQLIKGNKKAFTF